MGQQESQFSDEEEGEYNYTWSRTVFDLRITGRGIGFNFKVNDITNR